MTSLSRVNTARIASQHSLLFVRHTSRLLPGPFPFTLTRLTAELDGLMAVFHAHDADCSGGSSALRSAALGGASTKGVRDWPCTRVIAPRALKSSTRLYRARLVMRGKRWHATSGCLGHRRAWPCTAQLCR